MRLITIIAFVLAFGPAIFGLAVTGRAFDRPTRTSTSDWALTQSYTLHMGKPSLAILPTGLPVGAVLTESCHNNQDSVVPIWTVYRITTRRALANIGTFVTNFNGRVLDRQWGYIRGWWRFNSRRVIEEEVTVYLYTLSFLAVLLTIWRKRVLRQRHSEPERSATLAHPSPILANSVAIRSPARTDTIQPTQRTEQAMKRRPGSASSSFTTIHSIEGVLVMACCSTGNGLHWSIQFYPFQHYHISLQTGNHNDEEESIQATASDIEPAAQVVLAPSVNSDDGYESDEAQEEETEGNDLVEPTLVPLPPSRPASPEAEEELLRADFFPLADSRSNSPERHALDRSTHRSDLHQYIAALSHHYTNLRAMLVRPLLPGEARAIRAEMRPRLGSLGERARERRGLPLSTSVATELQGQFNAQEVVEQVNEQEVVEQVDEEVDEQVDEAEVDEQVDEAEVDEQVNEGEVEVSRMKKRPHRGGKKTRLRKHKHQMDKEEEADPTRED